MKKNYLCFIFIFCVLLLIPSVGMLFWPSNETTENKVLAEFPDLKDEDGNLNKNYMAEMGIYFEDHFAFRQQLVTANALLRGKIFRDSPADKVVIGTDGWLYYAGTLNDYRARNLFSGRELFAIAHNLKLMQEYVEKQGSRFILLIAPNKNSLYNEHMPYYYRKGRTSNWEQLKPYLEETKVSYVDLHQIFQEKAEVLYFKRDSHWNNKGALLVYNALMEKLGKEHESYLNVPFDVQAVHSGDLEEMLYPLAVKPEEDYVCGREFSYEYVNEVQDNMDDWIETRQEKKEGSLLMYRDSFGESLLPFLAEETGAGYFSRLVPYNLAQVKEYTPSCVVIERVERNLESFAEAAPIMEGVQTETKSAPEADTKSVLSAQKKGSYLLVQGEIEEKYLQEDTEVYISVRDCETGETKTYQSFYTLTEDGKGRGCQLYLLGTSLPAGEFHLSILVQNGGKSWIVASQDMAWN